MATVWGYNSDSGKIDSAPDYLFWFAFHSGIGWHGPFDTKQQALDFYAANKDKNPGWKAPTESNAAGIANVLGAPEVAQAIDSSSGGLNALVEDWLLRVGEILLGLVLIGVGIATITGVGNTVTKAIGKVPL